MGKKSPPPPPPQPDPKVVAAAQTGSNVNTAVANTVLGNANQYGPYGQTIFEQIGTYPIDDGNGHTIDVPKYQQTTTLSPEQQQLLDQQNQLGVNLNNIALQQSDRIGNLLGSPINAPIPGIQRDIGPTDFSEDRKRVEDAIYSRLNPQLERDKAALDTKLQNEGFVRGTEAYNQAIDEYNRQANDARMQAVLAGGQEQSRLFGLDLSKAQFGNQAYAQQLQSDLALRNQPINEISALMSGGQVQLPQFAGYQGGTVAGTPIGDYYMQNANRALQAWQTQSSLAAQQAAGLYGGIGSILGAGLYGLSDRRMKRDIKRIGTWLNGLPVYIFRYIGQPLLHIGFMAQEVEQVMPEAVLEINGIKHVNYALAVRS